MRNILALVAVSMALGMVLNAAHARGGGPSNLQNWSGYQQRLQESRGQVPNRSVSQPYTAPPQAYPGKAWKKKGRRK